VPPREPQGLAVEGEIDAEVARRPALGTANALEDRDLDRRLCGEPPARAAFVQGAEDVIGPPGAGGQEDPRLAALEEETGLRREIPVSLAVESRGGRLVRSPFGQERRSQSDARRAGQQASGDPQQQGCLASRDAGGHFLRRYEKRSREFSQRARGA